MKAIGKTKLFILLTLILSYVSAALFYILGGTYDSTSGVILASLYMFIPTIAVVVIQKFVYKEPVFTSFLVSFKVNVWFFVAWLFPLVLSIGTFGISLLFSQVYYSPEMDGMFERFSSGLTPEQMEEMRQSIEQMKISPMFIGIFQALIAGITINAVFGFGEEFAWRGFLLRQFNKTKFIKTALSTGFIWGIWHAPLILMGHNYPDYPVFGVFMMIVWCVLLSPMFLYITLQAKSVIAAAVMHGTLNASVGLAIILIEGGNNLIIGVTGVAGFITLCLLTGLFFVYDSYISKQKIMSKPISL